jgi:hypothetical protein
MSIRALSTRLVSCTAGVSQKRRAHATHPVTAATNRRTEGDGDVQMAGVWQASDAAALVVMAVSC